MTTEQPLHGAPRSKSRSGSPSSHSSPDAGGDTTMALRALFLEDNPDDAELLALELIQFGYNLEWLRVETEEEFVAQLPKSWDIILSDFSLPQFDALTALRHVRRLRMDTPVIVISGAIGEEQAVAAIHQGAVDYINKEYRGRLGAAVQNALSRRRMQRAQRDAQRQLARSEQQYRSLFEQNPDAVFSLDADGNFTSANVSLVRLTGYSLATLHHMSFESVVAPEDFERVVQHFTHALGGTPQNFDIRGLRQDKREFFANITYLPIVINGEIVGVYGIAKDITERKRREREQTAIVAIAESLRTNESRAAILQAVLERLSELFGEANAIFSSIDPDTQEIVTEAGVGKGEMWIGNRIPPGSGLSDTLINMDRPFVKHRGREYLVGKHQNPPVDMEKEPEFSMVGTPVRAQDKIVGAIWVSRPDPFGEHDVKLITTVSSMTGAALVRAEYAEEMQRLLRQTQDQARQMQDIVDTVPEAVLVLDPEQRILMANRIAKMLLPILGPARVGDILKTIDSRPVAHLLDAGVDQDEWAELALPAGQLLEYAVRRLNNYHSQTRPPHHPEPRPGYPAPQSASESGAVAHLLVLRDITEERRRHEAIQSQERLAMVGQLAAGIAHDFNNILAVISLYSGSLLKNPDLPKRIQYLETISRQTQHAASLIAQILDFSRRSMVELRDLDMSDFLLEMVRLLRRTLPENIEIQLNVGQEPMWLRADPTRIQQVLINLAFNARDAMPHGGTLTFGLRVWNSAHEFGIPLDLELPSGDWVVLTVTDSGHGVAQEHLPHIFEPFFTTKGPGKGTGLGLAQVYGIVKQHNGEIDVRTEINEGTTFNIFLPRLAASAPASPVPLTAAAAGHDARQVLLIEDNAEAMAAIYDILHDQLGYEVHSARSGQEALQIFRAHANRIDLILCDMVLPETDGIALYYAISVLTADASEMAAETEAATKPTLSAPTGSASAGSAPAGSAGATEAAPRSPHMILMSGYPLTDTARSLVEEGELGWIQKPFSPDQLASTIRSMLA